MPNLDLQKNKYTIDNDELKKYFNSDTISYDNLYTRKNRLENKETLNDVEIKALKWIDNLLNKETKKVDTTKRIQMNTGKENSFKDTHTKDKDNKNITKVGGLVKVTSSGEHSKTSDQIFNNRMTYYQNESYSNKIKTIKYLIEYLDNNKNII